jgi:hypothetical protein
MTPLTSVEHHGDAGFRVDLDVASEAAVGIQPTCGAKQGPPNHLACSSPAHSTRTVAHGGVGWSTALSPSRKSHGSGVMRCAQPVT